MESLKPIQSQNLPIDPMDQVNKDPGQSIPIPPVQVENINIKPKSKGPLIALLGILAVLILLIGSGAFLALVAYGKVDINNRDLERKISFAVQALPFTPKTAEYLIYQSFELQGNLKSVYFDASVALSGTQSTEIPGLGSNFDLIFQGPIDIHDENNMKAEINVKMTPELDADFVSVNKKLFFKVNSIPAVIKGIATGAGFSLDPFLMKWIVYDTKGLESEARNALNEDKDIRDTERIERIRTAILNSDVMQRIVVENTELDGKPVYKMTLEMSSQEYLKFVNDVARVLDSEAYGNQLSSGSSSETFENLKITTFIDRDTMYTVRSTMSFRAYTSDISVPSQVLGASTIQYFPNIYAQAVNPKDEYMDVAIVVNGSRFNENFDIQEPSGATPLETIIEEYTKQMMRVYQGESDVSGFEGFETLDEFEDESGISPF